MSKKSDLLADISFPAFVIHYDDALASRTHSTRRPDEVTSEPDENFSTLYDEEKIEDTR